MIHVGFYHSEFDDLLPSSLRFLQPQEFAAHKQEIREIVGKMQFWTNNPLLVDLFEADEVMCHTEQKSWLLSQHPDYENWKNEFSSGELWSFLGNIDN